MSHMSPKYSSLNYGEQIGSAGDQHQPHVYSDAISYKQFLFPRYKPVDHDLADPAGKRRDGPRDTFEIDPTSPYAAPLPRPAWYFYTVDVLNVIFSLLFIILAISIISLRGKEESDWGRKVVAATRLAPSIWPIFFAAVLGTAIRSYANWKLERGMHLGTLELLVGSHTVVGSLRSIFFLRILNVYSVLLIVLWAFNPLGSQASLRSVYLIKNNLTTDFGASFPTYRPEVHNSIMDGADFTGQVTVRSIFGSSIYSLEAKTQYPNSSKLPFDSLIEDIGGPKAAGEALYADPWGNVRIPRLMSLAEYDAEDPEKPINVPSGVVNYWSLVGVPIRTEKTLRNFNGSYTFNVGASFFDLDCGPWEIVQRNDSSGWITENYEKFRFAYNDTGNQTVEDIWGIMFPHKIAGFFFDVENDTSRTTETYRMAKTNVYFGSINRADSGGDASFTKCGVENHFVTTKILCESSVTSSKFQCRPQTMHRMKNESLPNPYFTILDTPSVSQHFHHFFPYVLNPKTEQRYHIPTEVENYLMGPIDAFSDQSSSLDVAMHTIPPELFSNRLSLVINSFWRSTLGPNTLLGGNFRFDPPTGDPELDKLTLYVNTTGRSTFAVAPTYSISGPWMAVFFLGNVVMLAATVVCVFFRYSCRCPEVLGFASSLVGGSQYLPAEARRPSTMDGVRLAQSLRGMRVMVGDVRGSEEFGKIGVALPENTVRPRKNRLYT